MSMTITAPIFRKLTVLPLPEISVSPLGVGLAASAVLTTGSVAVWRGRCRIWVGLRLATTWIKQRGVRVAMERSKEACHVIDSGSQRLYAA